MKRKPFKNVKQVLVLCHGNKYRSPLCAAILKSCGQDVESAGFMYPGNRAAKGVREFIKTLGLNLDEHRSKVVTQKMINAADVVLYMDHGNYKRLRQQFPEALEKAQCLGRYVGRRKIPDPAFTGGGSQQFLDIMHLIVDASYEAYKKKFVIL